MMPKIMTLPKLGVNMTEATIVEWLVTEGKTVNTGDHIVDVETDKAVQEIESTESGILARILARPGQIVQCQQPIAVFVEPGEELPEDFGFSSTTVKDSDTKETSIRSAAVVQSESSFQGSEITKNHEGVRISPSAKRLAKELGLDYTQIPPSESGARIVEADVLAFSEGKLSTHLEKYRRPYKNKITETIPLVGTRKTIAERMSCSARTNARTVLSLQADASRLIEWRESLQKEGEKVSYNDLLVVIVSRAISEFPIMNSRIAGDQIQLLADVNIGVAVDTEKGLMVPVIRNADRKNVRDISKEFQEKFERVQAGKSNSEDISGGTFTITNLGMLEIELFAPMINPPECAILGVGAIRHQPVVIDESNGIEVRPRLHLTLAFDHRIVDGAPAARFLRRIKHLLQEWNY
jgi:pyruvate dehydrogenase E2 component (dihydrolipoamide acetyltransferase)